MGYLELGFSRAMNPASVLDSELIITDLGDDYTLGTDDDHSFSIPISAATAEPNPLVKLGWNSDYTILQLTSSHPHAKLAENHKYRLQIGHQNGDNRAHSGGGEIDGPLPLILGPARPVVNFSSGMGTFQFTIGGSGDVKAIDLSSGFSFTTGGDEGEYPEVLWVTPNPEATG